MAALRTRRPAAAKAPPVSFAEGVRGNLPLLALAALFIAGSLCGTGLYSAMSAETSSALMFLLSGEGADSAFHFWSAFGGVFLSNFTVLALLFLCGFCAVSQPLILLVPFIKGLGFGLVAAYNTVLLSPYSAFFWIKFMPGAFLSTVLILLCARQSLSLSAHVFRSVFGPPLKEGRAMPASYGARYAFFLILCTAFSLADTVFDLLYEVVSTA